MTKAEFCKRIGYSGKLIHRPDLLRLYDDTCALIDRAKFNIRLARAVAQTPIAEYKDAEHEINAALLGAKGVRYGK